MTASNGPHGLWVDEETREALREYAWVNRTTMSNVVRAALESVAQGELGSPLDVEDRPGRVRLSVKVPDEEWAAAREAAAKRGLGFNMLLRRYIIGALKDDGLL